MTRSDNIVKSGRERYNDPMSFLRHHRRKLASHHHEGLLPRGIRLLAWARAIRWIGWGFGEALLPVFILLFSNTFAEMGLISASVEISGLVCLPLIGMWADRVPARRLVLWSLILYPLVGISYFLAGVWGTAIFIVIARIINGFTYELENIGIATYYRRETSEKKIAASFGYIETWSHVAWIAASLVGIVLVRFMPIHWLLFGIAPFALIAYFMVLRAPKDPVHQAHGQKSSFTRSFGRAIGEWRTWNSRLWLISLLMVFSSIVSSLVYFFVPIDAYLNGANLPMVVLIALIGTLPTLFAYKLGRFADRTNKYKLIALGLAGVAAVGVGLAVIPFYWFKLVSMFFMGVILEIFYVTQSSLVTTLGPEETYGERGSAFEAVITIGDLVAPLILGISLDLFGFGTVALMVAIVAIVLGFIYRSVRVGR